MNYGMFTPAGDAMVATIVERAKSEQWSWALTYSALSQLSRNHRDVAGEAMDTAVRECVYNAIRAYERDEEFYV